jgi:hypothetical protein
MPGPPRLAGPPGALCSCACPGWRPGRRSCAAAPGPPRCSAGPSRCSGRARCCSAACGPARGSGARRDPFGARYPNPAESAGRTPSDRNGRPPSPNPTHRPPRSSTSPIPRCSPTVRRCRGASRAGDSPRAIPRPSANDAPMCRTDRARRGNRLWRSQLAPRPALWPLRSRRYRPECQESLRSTATHARGCFVWGHPPVYPLPPGTPAGGTGSIGPAFCPSG